MSTGKFSSILNFNREALRRHWNDAFSRQLGGVGNQRFF